ncbi:uncharacterized protein LOC144115531 isoform X2 [Amblyomma americanum]
MTASFGTSRRTALTFLEITARRVRPGPLVLLLCVTPTRSKPHRSHWRRSSSTSASCSSSGIIKAPIRCIRWFLFAAVRPRVPRVAGAASSRVPSCTPAVPWCWATRGACISVGLHLPRNFSGVRTCHNNQYDAVMFGVLLSTRASLCHLPLFEQAT